MEEFERKLDRMIASIKEEAAGRICGDCEHSDLDEGGAGFCNIHEHILRWGPITISRNAPCCKQYHIKS